jgi:hypothetical protein
VRYHVRFVDDTALPGEVEWAFVTQAGRTCLFVKESAVDHATGECEALSRAWECWQDADAEAVPMRLVSV